MMIGRTLGIVGAILLHVAFILFGGLLFLHDGADHGTLQEVDLLAAEEEDEKEEQPEPEPDEVALEAEEEAPPDAAEIIRSLEVSPAIDAPALDAASLSAIEAALGGQAGGGGSSPRP